ncbi:transcriptional regulator, TetR family [Formosa agariphila KMM 3901]|uniref:Transcriptional regulator, TetR family n=1 Tax=Formosa agariphila (strain DSM 15362 / KCTC 12365 / LMG 23005 / KMM 3901 / M-2Alg 35-1) TaxID=1347342 RepID=T2KIV8_FORAG|nr:TetR/AcrR family transcriptional regulator [Formosa agariphila]CDF77919.1 transcriptional regulator, TetR family [Formosa agariphila KMM 3901]
MQTSRREQNKIEKRERIVKASLSLFSEKGLENTSISDIVEESKIGRGTFYNYFNAPKDVFCEILDRLNCEINFEVKQAQIGLTTAYDFLYASFKAYFDLVSSEEMIMFHKNNQNQIRSVSYNSESILSIVFNMQEDLKRFPEVSFVDEKYFKMFSLVAISSASELFVCLHHHYFEASKDEMAHFLANVFMNGLKDYSAFTKN